MNPDIPLKVEGRAIRHAKPGLDLGRDRGKSVVRRRSRNNHEIEVRGFKPRIGQSGLRRIKTEPRGRLVLGGDMALPYTRALHDPLVGRLQRFSRSALLTMRLGR